MDLTDETVAWFDHLSSAIWIFDRVTMQIIEANSAACALTGVAHSDMLKCTMADLLPERQRDDFRVAVAQCSGSQIDRDEWQFLTDKGIEITARFYWQVARHAGRDVLVATLKDPDTAPGISPKIQSPAEGLEAVVCRLREHELRWQLAERLLNVGVWEFDIGSGQTNWSHAVYEIYGSKPRETAPSLDEYIDLVHPDDREAMRSNYIEFLEGGEKQLNFRHRVLDDNETIRHVRGVGERHQIAGRETIVGFVEDVSSEVETADELAAARSLMRLAGQKANVGGWRVDLVGDRIEWSDETRQIHQAPRGIQPDLDSIIGLYEDEYRDQIERAFWAAAKSGKGFDQVAHMRTMKGNLIWVRAIGEPLRDERGRIIAVQGAIQDITDLITAREQAQRRQRELSDTLEHMGDAFIMLDRDWKITYVNSQAEALIRQSRESLQGEIVWKAFPEILGTSFERHYRSAMDEQKIVRFRENADALNMVAEVNAYPVPGGLAIYFRDVAEQERRDNRLKLLESAAARINDMLLITEAWPLDGPDGPKVVYVNHAFEKITGYSRHEIIGRTPRLLQGADTSQKELHRIKQTLDKDRPVRTELLNFKKSGKPYWVEIDIIPLRDEMGHTTHFVSVQRDISAEKEVRERLRKSEEMFRIVSEITNDYVWDYDVANDTIIRNERHLSMLGLSANSGPSTFDETVAAVHPDDSASVKESFKASLYGTDHKWEMEYRVLGGNGKTRYVKNLAAILRDENGAPVRVVGGLRDLTEVRKLDRQIREAQRMEALGQLTGGVAHDFNNLLTVIVGNMEELSQHIGDEAKLQSLADTATAAADRGAQLVNRLLSFARQQALAPRRVDLNAHLADVQGLLERTLPESISIGVRRKTGLWQAELDPGQLDNALLNLTINARDAMPDGGALTIETDNVVLDQPDTEGHPEVSPGHYVMVAISDNGTGMDDAVRTHAFEPFFTTKPMSEGSGLGLSMVYGFMKQSNGHVSIYSEIGVGTSIRLYFPATTPHVPHQSKPSPVTELQKGSEHILVVEDDQMVRENLERQLISLGYQVTVASDGHDALSVLRDSAGGFDLLFTDVIMPGGLNGRELADAALKMRPDLKVLFTSGYTDNAILHQGGMQPGFHLLSKPYRRQKLARKVREVIDG